MDGRADGVGPRVVSPESTGRVLSDAIGQEVGEIVDRRVGQGSHLRALALLVVMVRPPAVDPAPRVALGRNLTGGHREREERSERMSERLPLRVFAVTDAVARPFRPLPWLTI